MLGCKLTSFAIIFSHCKLVSNLYFFDRIRTGNRAARVAGSAKNVSDSQLSSSGSSEPIAYCAFLTDIFISLLLPRTVLKGTDFDLTYQRLFKLKNKSVRATGAPEVKATNCIQERSKREIYRIYSNKRPTSN